MQTQCKHPPHDTAENARGERASRRVLTLTAAMTVAEVTAGMAYGSMSLLADGWHMATHAAALGITVFAYRFARRGWIWMDPLMGIAAAALITRWAVQLLRETCTILLDIAPDQEMPAAIRRAI